MNWERIINIITYGFMHPNSIYTLAAEIIRHPRRLTLNWNVAPEVGCAEAVSWILLNSGYPVPHGGLQGVNALIDWMKANGFEEVGAPIPGAVITAHSPFPDNVNNAHTGICLNYGIGSNTSATGLFQENYTYDSWKKAFDDKGSVTRYFYHK